MSPQDVLPGLRVVYFATISNYGHVRAIKGTVVRMGEKRATIDTDGLHYANGRGRRLNVKPENLRPDMERL